MEQIQRLRFSVKETAELLSIGVSTLYKLMEAGHIESYVVGGRRWFDPAEVRRFVEDTKKAARS